MPINVGYIQYSPEDYPGLAHAVNVNDDGTVILGKTTGHGIDIDGVLKPDTRILSNSIKLTPERALELAAMLISAASKSEAIKQAAEEAKRMERQLRQANADRMAAIAAGETNMRVSMTVALESGQ